MFIVSLLLLNGLNYIPYQYIDAINNKKIYQTNNKSNQKPTYLVVKTLADIILKNSKPTEDKYESWDIYKYNKDCEDYALELQAELARYGYGNQYSNIVIVELYKNSYHALLEIQTEDKGIVYFDNLDGISKTFDYKIIVKQQDGYKFWKKF